MKKRLSNSRKIDAIQKELSRVRNLKRALEAEIELLRYEMEGGKLHIRINPNIKQELAKCLCKIFRLSYDENIHANYFTDGEIVYYEKPNRDWNSWSSEVNFKVIPIRDILSDNEQYDCWDEWEYFLLQDAIDQKYFHMMTEDKSEDWDEDILYFLQQEHPNEYRRFWEEQQEIAINFFLGEIPDEYTIEISS